jgi:hypothetical protein
MDSVGGIHHLTTRVEPAQVDVQLPVREPVGHPVRPIHRQGGLSHAGGTGDRGDDDRGGFTVNRAAVASAARHDPSGRSSGLVGAFAGAGALAGALLAPRLRAQHRTRASILVACWTCAVAVTLLAYGGRSVRRLFLDGSPARARAA